MFENTMNLFALLTIERYIEHCIYLEVSEDYRHKQLNYC
jgi:hypothetical protein